MKFLYIALNILFITVVVIASRDYLTPRNQSPVNKTKKVKSITASPVKTKQKIRIKKVKQLNANIAVQYNLFDPNRGISKKSKTDTKNPMRSNNNTSKQFKLVGVYRFGKKHGAVIISSGKSNRSHSGRHINSNASSKSKRFYQLGEVLSNGFTLKKVETRTVVLSRGSESITLEIEHNNPTIRETSTPKNKAKRVSMQINPPSDTMPMLEQILEPLPTIIN